MNLELIKYLANCVTDSRLEVINKVLNLRSRYITVVLEDLFQPHNASAVLRTCDCFGIQDVHIIENENKYEVNRDIALGSAQWLTLNKYNKTNNNTLETIKFLRNEGYRIVATTPHTKDVNLEDFDISKGKIALFFGSERPGLSSIVLDNADEFLKIPMVGFTESFNISVSAAIILHHLTLQLRKSEIEWQLSETEKNILMYKWLYNSLKDPQGIEKEFFKRYGK